MSNPRLITQKDYQQYIANKPNNRVELIWASIVSQLSSEILKKEARSKGFALVPHDSIHEDGISEAFSMTVPNGSIQLITEFSKLHNIVSLLRE
jgi:hypothetical protein